MSATARLALAAALVAVAALASPAAAGNQCKPYFYEHQVGPLTVPGVDIVC